VSDRGIGGSAPTSVAVLAKHQGQGSAARAFDAPWPDRSNEALADARLTMLRAARGAPSAVLLAAQVAALLLYPFTEGTSGARTP
jgi:hypothetical protein